MSERITTDVVADILANVATEPPWRVLDDGNVRHVAARFGAMIAEDVGDDAPLLAAAPDLAADLLDARRELARLRPIADAARAHVAELAALVAAEAAHSGPQPTAAARRGAMGALLVARGGVVGTVAGLAGAVGDG